MAKHCACGQGWLLTDLALDPHTDNGFQKCLFVLVLLDRVSSISSIGVIQMTIPNYLFIVSHTWFFKDYSMVAGNTCWEKCHLPAITVG